MYISNFKQKYPPSYPFTFDFPTLQMFCMQFLQTYVCQPNSQTTLRDFYSLNSVIKKRQFYAVFTVFQKGFLLGFPRDGTSRCPFVPGQKSFACPVVPLSRDKKYFLSRCPFVPGQGQEQMSRDKLLCPGMSRDKMNLYLSCFRTSFSVLERLVPVLESPFPVLEHFFLF